MIRVIPISPAVELTRIFSMNTCGGYKNVKSLAFEDKSSVGILG